MLKRETYDTLSQHFDINFCKYIVAFDVLLNSVKPKTKDFINDNFKKRIIKKFQRAMWEDVPDDCELIFEIVMELHNNEQRESLNGLGGCPEPQPIVNIINNMLGI